MTTVAELAAKSIGTPNRPATSGSAVISAASLDLTFQTNDGPVHALKDVTLDINKGDFVSFIGPSGCGIEGLLP